MNTPVSHKHYSEHGEGFGMSITRASGQRDGEEMHMVVAKMQDGTERGLWISTVEPGYFRQVFVPWDFTCKEILEDRPVQKKS